MRIVISQDDGKVYVDGVARTVNVSELAGEIRAISFDTVTGAGHIEFDPGFTVEVQERDFAAERVAELAAGDDRAKQAALVPIYKVARRRRENQPIADFAPFQVYLERWTAAAPPPPTATELASAALAEKRAAALRALDDARLAAAALDPAAPQEVKDYAALSVATASAT